MTTQVVIVGAGGFGRELRDWLAATADSHTSPIEFLGFLDDADKLNERLLRGQHLGPVTSLTHYSDAVYYVGIGDPAVRRNVVEYLDSVGAKAGPAVVHPNAVVGSDVEIGPGSVICPGAIVTTNIRVGRHTQLHVGSTLGHDVVVSDFVTVSPGATISGNVTLRDGVMVGTNAAINQGLLIGENAKVGAGAAVVRDVSEETTVVGVPAKPLGLR